MRLSVWCKTILFLHMLMLICINSFANEDLYKKAKTLQHEGKFNEAIEAYKNYLLQPLDKNNITSQTLAVYTDALIQMMNSFQSKGEPEACITTLEEVFKATPAIQDYCLRDFYSVMGYALSRTEKMKEAEEMILKAFTIPLYQASPERLFRDYAYAAAVFYSNPTYQKEVIYWCEEALKQAELCKNKSGEQWVMAMLGSIYKRNGYLNKSLKLY